MQGFRVPNATLECQCLGEPAAENTALSTSVASVEILLPGKGTQ